MMDPIALSFLAEFIVITPHVLQDHDAKVGERVLVATKMNWNWLIRDLAFYITTMAVHAYMKGSVSPQHIEGGIAQADIQSGKLHWMFCTLQSAVA